MYLIDIIDTTNEINIIEEMEKKKRDTMLPKRFNEEDVKKWQEQANLTTGGNLSLFMVNGLNDAVKKQNVKSKQ
jgi:hypothetical protein